MRVFNFIFALLVSIVAFADTASNEGTNRTWITDVAIISPENLEHVETGSVLIENGRIIRVDVYDSIVTVWIHGNLYLAKSQ